jgi:hypothetical protein
VGFPILSIDHYLLKSQPLIIINIHIITALLLIIFLVLVVLHYDRENQFLNKTFILPLSEIQKNAAVNSSLLISLADRVILS